MIGEYLTAGNQIHAVVDTFASGALTGSPQELSPVGLYLGIQLSSISCSTATSCVAVGAQASQSAEYATYAEENAGVWGQGHTVSNPKNAPTPSEYLSSVSCVAPSNCVASGNWVGRNGNGFSETYTESGGAWGHAVDLPLPSTYNNPFADGISCVASVNTCTVVGALSDNNGSLHSATAQMTNGKWGQLAVAGIPFGAITDHELLGVSCTAGVQCTSVGYYNTGGSTAGTQAMAATWVTGLPPGAVTGLHATTPSNHTAHLSWSAPVNIGTGVNHFEVTATLVGRTSVDMGPIVGLSTTVSKLTPGATYRLGVTSVGDDGQVSATAMVTVRMPPTTPSAPRITRVVGIRRGLRVSWSPPTSTGGAAISSYRVTTSCAGNARTAHASGSARQVTFGGLPAGATCVVRVYAGNTAGESPSSRPAKGRPLA
jgi:hypothetical protein